MQSKVLFNDEKHFLLVNSCLRKLFERTGVGKLWSNDKERIAFSSIIAADALPWICTRIIPTCVSAQQNDEISCIWHGTAGNIEIKVIWTERKHYFLKTRSCELSLQTCNSMVACGSKVSASGIFLSTLSFLLGENHVFQYRPSSS